MDDVGIVKRRFADRGDVGDREWLAERRREMDPAADSVLLSGVWSSPGGVRSGMAGRA